jgi:PhnB protein
MRVSLSPYLYFDGQCEEAFKFYEKCLAGKITFMMSYEGSPMASQTPPGFAKKILHAGLTIGDGVLEGCDAPPGEYKRPQSFCIMFRPKDVAEADRCFNALAEGGTVQIPIGQTFWALRFGHLVDRFRMPWLINLEKSTAGEQVGSRPIPG